MRSVLRALFRAPRRLAIAVLLPVVLLAGCAGLRPDPAPRVVLVHGAWMGAWAWDDVVRELDARGIRATAVELPGHGDDPTPPDAVRFDDYVDAVLRALPRDERVLLVGHSMGGMVISAVAERAPERIARLVYVAAYLPRSGESLYGLSQTDAGSLVGRYWRQDDPARYSPATIAADGIVPVFCADCDPSAAARLVARHRAEPVPPLATAVTLTPERHGRVPRAAVQTRDDRAVSLALQQAMWTAAGGAGTVVVIDGGHAPMLSRPRELADRLARFARSHD